MTTEYADETFVDNPPRMVELRNFAQEFITLKEQYHNKVALRHINFKLTSWQQISHH